MICSNERRPLRLELGPENVVRVQVVFRLEGHHAQPRILAAAEGPGPTRPGETAVFELRLP